MASVSLQQTLLLHLAQLVGKGTAVYAQVVCQLLAAEGDIKFPAAVFHGLIGKIGQQPAADGFGRGMENAAGKIQVFSGGNGKQIVDDLIIEGTECFFNCQEAEKLIVKSSILGVFSTFFEGRTKWEV